MGAARAAMAWAMVWATVTGLGAAALVSAGERLPPAAGAARQASEDPTRDEADIGRDPFARPTAPESRSPVEAHPAGLAGLSVDEAILRGVVSSRRGRLAVLEAPDARTYVVRPGDRLHDGTVRAIAADAVSFVRDAGSRAPPAERLVRRRLRDTGEER